MAFGMTKEALRVSSAMWTVASEPGREAVSAWTATAKGDRAECKAELYIPVSVHTMRICPATMLKPRLGQPPSFSKVWKT